MKEPTKICRECGEERPLSDFYKKKGMKDGHLNQCRFCCMSATRQWREVNENRLEHNRRVRERHRKLRLEAIAHYSKGATRCACCGEERLPFLTIDHVNNNGAQHRRTMGEGSISSWLKTHGWPDGFQVLCFNCNCGRQYNGGICPHEEERAAGVVRLDSRRRSP